MPERASETILKALLAALATAAPAGASVTRNTALPVAIPAAGAIVLRDGATGDPEVLLSPLTYLYDHAAEIDLIVAAPDSTRDAVFDTLVRAVGAAVTADRTLGGLCDWVELGPPAPVELAEDGAVTAKAATITATLSYATDSPVG